MHKISDSELIGELRRRLDENRKALYDLEILTKKLESVNAKLKESEALKSNFLSNIRNEINNPLTSILSISQQIVDGYINPEDVLPMVKLIYGEAFELDFQLKNIFFAAELEAGEMPISVAKVDMTSLIGGVVNAYRHRAEAKKLKLDLKCTPPCKGEPLMFKTDPEKLGAILSNLLANAIEYSLEGKKVSVNAELKDGSLKLAIIDEGIGIKAEDQRLIFDRFKQLDSGVRKSHRGHGLGLSIVKAMLDILGAKFELSSLVGQGTTFEVTLPESASGTDVDVYSDDENEFIFESEEEF